MSGLVDSCDLELLQKSYKTGKKLTISMSGIDDSNAPSWKSSDRNVGPPKSSKSVLWGNGECSLISDILVCCRDDTVSRA